MFSSKILDLVIIIIVFVLAVFAVDFYTEGGISGFFLGARQPAEEGLGYITPGNVTEGLTVGPGQEIGEEETQQETEEPEEETETNDTDLRITGGFYGGGGGTGGGGSSPSPEEPPEEPEEPQPPEEPHFVLDSSYTNNWMDVYGSLTIGGEPAQVGDEVAAFDPDGVLCGIFRVKTEGIYGFLHIYENDTLTPTIDEGAEFGDTITFKVYDWSEDLEINVNPDINLIWIGNRGKAMLDISV